MKRKQLRARVVLVDDRVADVRAVEARHEDTRAARAIEARDDLGARLRVGGGGERDARHAADSARAAPTAAGTRAGNRAPTAIRSAPRRWRTARSPRASSSSRQRGVDQPLGRDVERGRARRRRARARSRARFRRVLRRVEERRAHAELQQRRDLVLHQRDQRRDDDPGAGAHQRRDLVAQRLAAAGRHQHQRVAAARRRGRRPRPGAAEARVAEGLAQQLAGPGGGENWGGCGVGHRVCGSDGQMAVKCGRSRAIVADASVAEVSASGCPTCGRSNSYRPKADAPIQGPANELCGTISAAIRSKSDAQTNDTA